MIPVSPARDEPVERRRGGEQRPVRKLVTICGQGGSSTSHGRDILSYPILGGKVTGVEPPILRPESAEACAIHHPCNSRSCLPAVEKYWNSRRRFPKYDRVSPFRIAVTRLVAGMWSSSRDCCDLPAINQRRRSPSTNSPGQLLLCYFTGARVCVLGNSRPTPESKDERNSPTRMVHQAPPYRRPRNRRRCHRRRQPQRSAPRRSMGRSGPCSRHGSMTHPRTCRSSTCVPRDRSSEVRASQGVSGAGKSG